MNPVVSAPVEWLETIGDLRLPAQADHRLQDLMDRNNQGKLSQTEHAELEALVEMSERLSLIRSEALRLLGRSPE